MASPDRRRRDHDGTVVAKLLGFHVGDTIPSASTPKRNRACPASAPAAVKPALEVNMQLVGLTESELADRRGRRRHLPDVHPADPAFAREVLALKGAAVVQRPDLRHPDGRWHSFGPAGRARDRRSSPRRGLHRSRIGTGDAPRPTTRCEPIAIALGVFGAVTLLAAVLVATQLVARRLRTEAADRADAAGVGASPADTVLDGALGLEAAILARAVLADGVAVGLSPIAPLGPVRPVYPDGGFAFDWTVLGFGAVDPRSSSARPSCASAVRAAHHIASPPRPPAVRLGVPASWLRGPGGTARAPAWSGRAWHSNRVRAAAPYPSARRSSARSSP